MSKDSDSTKTSPSEFDKKSTKFNLIKNLIFLSIFHLYFYFSIFFWICSNIILLIHFQKLIMQVWGLKTLQNDFLVFFGFYFMFHLVSRSNILKKPNFKVAVTGRQIMNFAQTLQVTVHQLAF